VVGFAKRNRMLPPDTRGKTRPHSGDLRIQLLGRYHPTPVSLTSHGFGPEIRNAAHRPLSVIELTSRTFRTRSGHEGARVSMHNHVNSGTSLDSAHDGRGV
jgi:hypothetical protein